MGEETSKGLIMESDIACHGTEKVPYSPVKKNKSDYYCILSSFSMDFSVSPPLVTGTREDVFQLESWGFSMAHTLFKIKCSASAGQAGIQLLDHCPSSSFRSNVKPLK